MCLFHCRHYGAETKRNRNWCTLLIWSFCNCDALPVPILGTKSPLHIHNKVKLKNWFQSRRDIVHEQNTNNNKNKTTIAILKMARINSIIYHMLILCMHGCWSSRSPSSSNSKQFLVKINCTRDLFNIKLDMGKSFRGIVFAKDFLVECRARGNCFTTGVGYHLINFLTKHVS